MVKTVRELEVAMEKLIPGAQMEEDNYGQIIFYTNLTEKEGESVSEAKMRKILPYFSIDYDNDEKIILYTDLMAENNKLVQFQEADDQELE